MTTAHTATPPYTQGQLGDVIEIDAFNLSIDWPATDERHECGSDHYPITVTSGDPDELAANAARVKLCWNVHADLVKAAKAAERLLDSVAFVSKEGDTDKPLHMLRAALAKAGAA